MEMGVHRHQWSMTTRLILFLIVGVVSLEEAADLDVSSVPAFLHLDPTTRGSLRVKINVLKEELILKYFLEEYDLLKYRDRYVLFFG